MSRLRIAVPPVYSWLFKKAKYKICYGGRGGGRSWGFAEVLLILAAQKRERILCARELQNSIAESVHQLLEDQIERIGLSSIYEVKEKEIICKTTGSIFLFKGIRHNIKDIKSMEGITKTWVEEAQGVTEESWKNFLPTIFRTDGAELWITFNPEYEDDATYERFVKNSLDNAIVKHINYDQNIYFPKDLDEIRLDDLKNRPNDYPHVWLGVPKGYGGKVFPEFIDKSYPDGHIREFDFKVIEETGNIIMACDPAQKYYPACIWAAVFPFNKRMHYPDDFFIWIYNEYPTFADFGDYFYKFRKQTLCNLSLEQLSVIFKSKDSSGHALKCHQRFIDTRFATGTGGTSLWNNDTLGLVELFAEPKNGNIIFELPNVRFIDMAKYTITEDLLCNRRLEINQFNCPRLYISNTCKNLRYSMFNHRTEENSEKESEKLKDFSDCLKILYAGLKEYRYRDPKKLVAIQEKKQRFLSDFTTTTSDSWMG